MGLAALFAADPETGTVISSAAIFLGGWAAADTHAGEVAEATEQYPYLLEVVAELAESGYEYDAEFTVGLDVLLDGIETLRSSWRSA